MERKQYFELENVVFVPFLDFNDCLQGNIAKMTAGRKAMVILHVTHRS